MLTYSLDHFPFSLPGSFLTLTSRNTSGSHRLVYKTCSARAVSTQSMPFQASEFFEIALIRDNKELTYEVTAQPHRVDLLADGDANATFIFADPQTLLFSAHSVDVRFLPLKPFATEFSPAVDQVCLVDSPARGIHFLRAKKSTQLSTRITPTVSGLQNFHNDLPRSVDFTSSTDTLGALRFQPFEGEWTDPLPDFDDTLVTREQEFLRWQAKIPKTAEQYQDTAEQAWLLLWSCMVPAGGALTRPAIYMSKFWMNAIWAWDNCFNALAIADADPDLAWNQLLLFFDHQDPNGMVPDMINDLEPIYAFNKPPIQGWTIRKLVEKTGLNASRPYLEKLYKPLSHLTEWWYTYRDFDKDGMCQYHHGNDSGWDNATLFDQGYPTEGADLAAHLTLQCESLGMIAGLLGKPNAAKKWQERANHQLKDLLKQGVSEKHFFSPLNGEKSAPETQSLLNYIPIELGSRLPKDIRRTLARDLSLEGPFLTEYGLATEAPASSKYEPDGYWRGPIWAPSTYLIFDGLVHAGEVDLAHTIAERFCDLCDKEPGFWENYNALTGKGLRCPGYSWTASVFLLLAEWLTQFDEI